MTRAIGLSLAIVLASGSASAQGVVEPTSPFDVSPPAPSPPPPPPSAPEPHVRLGLRLAWTPSFAVASSATASIPSHEGAALAALVAIPVDRTSRLELGLEGGYAASTVDGVAEGALVAGFSSKLAGVVDLGPSFAVARERYSFRSAFYPAESEWGVRAGLDLGFRVGDSAVVTASPATFELGFGDVATILAYAPRVSFTFYAGP